MLKVMEVLRNNSSMEVKLDSKGMYLDFLYVVPVKPTIRFVWKLSGYPERFVKVARRACLRNYDERGFEVCPSGDFYQGNFYKGETEDFAILKIAGPESSAVLEIVIRRTEILKLILILEEYWTS